MIIKKTCTYLAGPLTPGPPEFDCTHSSATIKPDKQKNSVLVWKSLLISNGSVKALGFRCRTISAGFSPSQGPLTLCLFTSHLPSHSHLSSSSNFTFYIVSPALYFSGTSPILWIAFYPGTRSMSQGEHVACNLCGSRIYSFSSTQISDIVYRDTRKDLNASPLHYPWVHGNPADLDDIHFNETWTWSWVWCKFLLGLAKESHSISLVLASFDRLIK